MVRIPFDIQWNINAEQLAEGIERVSREARQRNTGYSEASETKGDSQNRLNQLRTIMSRDTSGLKGNQKAQADMMNFAAEGFKKGAQGLMNITQQSFDVLQTIYKELKKSSPLLEAVENLFNLAMTLFFMPLGNKLGEILIPAVIELLDNVVDMWDELGDGGLASMFDAAISNGITYLAGFFNNVGDLLIEQGGIFADIGGIFKALASFIEHHLFDTIKLILNWAEWNVSHLGTLITLIGSFMSLHYALQLATMAVIAASMPGLTGKVLGGAAVAVAAGGIALSTYTGSKVGFATGGYVPATPGGQVVRVAEGGEGEYIIPKSQADSIGGVTNNWYISGLTQDDLVEIIDDRISRQISRSRIQGSI